MIFVLTFCVVFTIILQRIFAVNRLHRSYLFNLNAVQWLVYLLLMFFINEFRPLTAIGDDNNYYYFMQGFNNLYQVFNPYSYAGTLEQPGYPMYLGLASFLSGADLFSLKMMNITAAIALTTVYSRIGFELEGDRLARAAAVFVALLSPLWFYFFFLLKDLPIAFLQSVSLLGAILLFQRQAYAGTMLLAISIPIIIVFRSFLAVMSICLAAVAVIALSLSRDTGRSNTKLIALPLALLGMVGLIYLVLNPETAAYLGVITQSRNLTVENLTLAARAGERSSLNYALFPILYFITETSGFAMLFKGFELTDSRIRGLLAIPWIAIFLPFLALGSLALVRRYSIMGLITTPWVILIAFLIGYLAISFIVGDTTRWRIPDMPALATVAAFGYVSTRSSTRRFILISWPAAVLLGSFLYYSVTA